MINEANKKVVEQCIKKLGIDAEIILCINGVDILRYVINDEINKNIKCIITEEKMEYLNVWDVSEFIKKLETRFYIKKIPCILLSFQEDLIKDENLILNGINNVLWKPLNVSGLTDVLKNINFNKL